MKRMKKKRMLKKRDIFVCISILISFLSYCFLKLIDKSLMPVLYNYAASETITLTTLLINESVKNYTNSISINDNIKTVTNNNNEIVSIDFDTLKINKSLYEITENIQYNLKKLENRELNLQSQYDIFNDGEGIVYYIPVGVVFKNSILSNLGPKIPVSASVIGDVVSKVRTETSSYGINNSLIKVYVDIEVSAMVVLPFASEKVDITNEILVGMKVVQGSIPKFYGSAFTTSAPLVTSD